MIAVQLFLAKENFVPDDRLISHLIDRLFPTLVSPDSNNLFDGGNEDFTIPDLPSLRRLENRLDNLLSHIVRGENFQFHFRQKIDRVFGAAVKLGMAFLAAEAFHLGDGEAGNADLVQRVLHVVELERLDDRFDLLHALDP